ncbi:MAG: hypothetical protein C0594_00205, partial [Marinilabiliales bacterium]
MQSDGSVTVESIDGGTIDAIEWSDGQTGTTASNLPAGNYWVYVTIAEGGCSDSLMVTVINEDGPVVSDVILNDVSCNGDATGSIDITVTGGNPTYSYNWTTPDGCGLIASDEDQTDLCAGQYFLTITDADGCPLPWDTTITEPTLLELTYTTTDLVCNGVEDGAIDLTITGGIPPYEYNWDSGQTTDDLENIGAGTYTVVVRDQNNCTLMYSVIVTEPPLLETDIAVTNSVCGGSGDASLDLTVTGGTMATDYSYLWSNSSTSQDLSNLYSGEYFVTVEDDNGCSVIDSATVDSILVISLDVSIDSSHCGICDGIGTVTASNGVAPYTYNWTNGNTNAVCDTLCGGILYSITVTDVDGCTATEVIPMSDEGVGNLVIQRTNVDCYSNASGSATAVITGGDSPFTYDWSNSETDASISNLVADTYYLTLTDVNACKLVDSVIITQPDDIILSLSVTDILCNGETTGDIDLSVVGGTVAGDYSYLWSDNSTTQDLTSLSAGEYIVTVTDDNLCSKVAVDTVVEPVLLEITSVSISNNSCSGYCDASVAIIAQGGTGNITYILNNGSSDISNATGVFTNLCPGFYVPRITDVNGCLFIGDTVNLTEPTPFVIETSQTNANCGLTNGEACVDNVTGPVGAISYSWTGSISGATDQACISNISSGLYIVDVSADGCTYSDTVAISDIDGPVVDSVVTVDVLPCNGNVSGEIHVYGSGASDLEYSLNGGPFLNNDGEFTNLQAGSYIVAIKDDAGCQVFTQPIYINEPEVLLVAGVDKQDVAGCFADCTGEITIHADGGAGVYYYSVDNGNTYQTGDSIFNNLCAGTYQVMIQDVYGCEANGGLLEINEPDELTIDPDPVGYTDVSCYDSNNGAISIVASGGTGTLNYSINAGSSFSTSNSFTGLSDGIYEIVVEDANGCQALGQDVEITQPEILLTNVQIDSSGCGQLNGQAEIVVVSGGTSPFTFEWSDGQTNALATGLSAGNYEVVINHANTCSDTVVVSISDIGAGQLEFADVSNVNCYGGSDGSVSVLINNGNPPHSYSWNTGATDTLISNLSAGTYTVEATDNIGCVLADNITITQPDAVETDFSITNILCAGETNGFVDLTVSGGTPGFTFAWSNTETTEDLTNLPAGNYTVTVTDANLCSMDTTISVVEPTEIDLTLIIGDVACNNESSGDVQTIVNGGIPPYSYEWSTGATSSYISNLVPDEYFLTVTDANGCYVVDTALVGEPGSMIITTAVDSSTCGNDDGSAWVVDVTGGGGDGSTYFYEWNTGEFTQAITDLAVGNYSVTVTNSDGCSDSVYVAVPDISGPEIESVDVTDVLCYGQNTGSICVTANTPYPSLSYNWSNGETDDCINSLEAGVYLITVTDGLGCQTPAFDTVHQPDPIELDYNYVSTTCPLGDDGTIGVEISGGIPDYSILWSTTSTDSEITDLASGDYYITVTDANSCSVMDTVSVVEPDAILANEITIDVTCYGYNDGEVAISPSGGTSPYEVEWYDGTTGLNQTGLTAGFYNLTITDANMCESVITVSIGEPCELSSTFIDSSLISCGGDSSGYVTAMASCGTPPYTYQWDDDLAQTTATADSLPAFIYHVVITDANGCTHSNAFEMRDTSSLALAIIDSSSISCNGLCDGYLIAEATGGNIPYEFNWYNATPSVIQTTAGQSIDSLEQLCKGAYILQLLDDSLCSRTIEFPIVEPDLLSVSVVDSMLVSCADTCNGSLTVSVTGGILPYDFNWSTGATDSVATGLCAENSVYLTVSDFNGCEVFVEDSLPSAVPIVILVDSLSGTTCSSNSFDGYVNINVNGGAAHYSYFWSNNETTQIIDSVESGWYYVTVTDSLNCSHIDSINVPPGLVVEAIAYDDYIMCAGSNYVITADSSINANVFAWSPNVEIDDSTLSSPVVSPIETTSYVVYVEDSITGCFDLDTVLIEVLPLPEVDAGDDLTIYPDESVMIDAYTNEYNAFYQWEPVVGLDNPIIEDPMVDVDYTTTYVLTVTASNGCINEDTVKVNVIPKLDIPDGFTPNGDDVNNVWVIGNIENYTTTVQIYNRWGQLLYESDAYQGNEWDGTYNGKELPAGT